MYEPRCPVTDRAEYILYEHHCAQRSLEKCVTKCAAEEVLVYLLKAKWIGSQTKLNVCLSFKKYSYHHHHHHHHHHLIHLIHHHTIKSSSSYY